MEHRSLECIWIEIFQKNAKGFLVGTMYRPPVGSKYFPKDFEIFLGNMLLMVMADLKKVNLLGDLNVNYLKKADSKSIKEMLNLYGLNQLITQETRITEQFKTLIECILTSHSDWVYEHDVKPTSISDHDMVGFVRKMKKDKLPPKIIKSRNYAKYTSENMTAELRNHNWSPLY